MRECSRSQDLHERPVVGGSSLHLAVVTPRKGAHSHAGDVGNEVLPVVRPGDAPKRRSGHLIGLNCPAGVDDPVRAQLAAGEVPDGVDGRCEGDGGRVLADGSSHREGVHPPLQMAKKQGAVCISGAVAVVRYPPLLMGGGEVVTRGCDVNSGGLPLAVVGLARRSGLPQQAVVQGASAASATASKGMARHGIHVPLLGEVGLEGAASPRGWLAVRGKVGLVGGRNPRYHSPRRQPSPGAGRGRVVAHGSRLKVGRNGRWKLDVQMIESFKGSQTCRGGAAQRAVACCRADVEGRDAAHRRGYSEPVQAARGHPWPPGREESDWRALSFHFTWTLTLNQCGVWRWQRQALFLLSPARAAGYLSGPKN
mmetsp:Transcript_3155/g.8959  ORF Transcript_3155/g.8959 Transcript_3155/m.8959 type:complete len:367 (+) Transcript_3155:556-1656(+)